MFNYKQFAKLVPQVLISLVLVRTSFNQFIHIIY